MPLLEDDSDIKLHRHWSGMSTWRAMTADFSMWLGTWYLSVAISLLARHCSDRTLILIDALAHSIKRDNDITSGRKP